MTIIATKGTLDWAYPPFILASTAGALGWDVSMFFTFYGLGLLRKDISDLKVGCQMTVDLFGYSRDDFIPEVKDYVGAATFLPMARDADVSLFI
ncbi:MAG: DsrE/DsrF/DrsH-like family protein [Betaproteobacteria bacterium]|nr:DsrE/DsrF/DrsH-like family protein [Betaproteobacteria bacterium]